MNILIYNKQQIGASFYLVKLTSDIHKNYNKLIRVKTEDLERTLHQHNVAIMQAYLLGFIQNRLIAYTKKHAYCQTRIKQLTILLNYLQKSEKNPLRFYSIVLKWETLLINSLPFQQDISHQKVNAIIQNCHKQISKYDETRIIPAYPRINNTSQRLDTNSQRIE